MLVLFAVFSALLLVRTRVGLIYEVAKMNVLLGLPIGRVKRINPLSIFFLMQSMVSLAGGVSAALFGLHLLALAGLENPLLGGLSALIGVVMAVGISRFVSTLDGMTRGYLEDPIFARIVQDDLATGQHRNPTNHPAYFTTAFFHHPMELKAE